MRRLFIAGAGGFGREWGHWVRHCPRVGTDFNLAGFLDDNLAALESRNSPCAVVGRIADFEPDPGDAFIVAVGSPQAREAIHRKLAGRGMEPLTLVHPRAVLGGGVSLAPGCLICPYVTISCDVTLGLSTALNFSVGIGHDARLGDFCQLSPFSVVTGAATLGDRVFLGTHASVLPTVHVGDDAFVGAHAFVSRDLAPGTRLAASPSRRI